MGRRDHKNDYDNKRNSNHNWKKNEKRHIFRYSKGIIVNARYFAE